MRTAGELKGFVDDLERYENATVELINISPEGSEVADLAIRNLRECREMRLMLEMMPSGRRMGPGRRLADLYPDAHFNRHFPEQDRRTGPRRQEQEA